MTILITGATGFIGASLLEFLSKDHQVFGIAREKKEDKRIIPSNLLNYEETSDAISQDLSKVDVIIHLASKMASQAEADDISILFDNVTMSKNVFLLAKKLQAQKVINFSSTAVYPNVDGNYDEVSIIDPSPNTDCIYGLSKFNSEVLLNFWLSKENILLSNLRVSQVYGENMNKDRIMPIMEKELREKNTITVFGDGERIINFTSIDYLISTVKLFVEKDLPGIYNVGERNVSILNIAEEIILKMGNKDSKILKTKAGNRSRFNINTNKLKTINN